jgi:predicted nuclease with TOPRIM domain
MHVMARETWTDERLGDLTKHMDENFREVRTELRQQRAEMTSGFESVRGEIGEVREELGEMRAEVKGQRETMDAKFDALNRTLQIGFGLIGAVLTGLLGMLAAQF